MSATTLSEGVLIPSRQVGYKARFCKVEGQAQRGNGHILLAVGYSTAASLEGSFTSVPQNAARPRHMFVGVPSAEGKGEGLSSYNNAMCIVYGW